MLWHSVKDTFLVDSDAKDANTRAAREILRYFLRHPDSADSLTEIARWRLMQEQVRQSVETTLEALQGLVSEGYVIEERRLGTERIFQLNAKKRKEAEVFVRRETGKKGQAGRESEHG
jgi:hypothetical protein